MSEFECHVTTNTELLLCVPALAVTVRSAFWNIVDREEQYAPGWAVVGATFQIGKRAWKGDDDRLDPARDFVDVLDPEGRPVETTKVTTRTALASTAVAPFARKREVNERDVGQAHLPLFGLHEGTWILRIVPPAEQRSAGPAGPDTPIPEKGNVRDAAYRPLHVMLRLDDSLRLTHASTCAVERDGRVLEKEVVVLTDREGKGVETVVRPVMHGYVTAHAAGELAIDLKPDVMRSVMVGLHKRPRGPDKEPRPFDAVVVHRSGAATIGGSIGMAFGWNADGSEPYTPHYYLDRDGHAVKLAREEDMCWHAGVMAMNQRAIGIEIVGEASKDYPKPQMDGLAELLMRYRSRVKAQHFVGHSDVLHEYIEATGPDANDGKIEQVTLKKRNPEPPPKLKDVVCGCVRSMSYNRWSCPGAEMDWPRLERLGIGWQTTDKELTSADYGGFFSLTADELRAVHRKATDYLRFGDSDGASTWGGVDWSTPVAQGVLAARAARIGMTGIVAELQRDLIVLGYFCDEDGLFDMRTRRALLHFLRHTCTTSRLLKLGAWTADQTRIHFDRAVASCLKGTAEWVRGNA